MSNTDQNKETFWTDTLVEQFIKEQFFTRELKYLDAAIDDFKRDNKQEDKPKEKQKLFTTEDCIDIYEDMRYYVVITKDGFGFEPYSVAWCGEGTLEGANYKDHCKTFADKEKANEYILLNNPVLSVNDIKWWLEKYFDYPNGINPSQLTELAKSKL